MKRSFDLWKSLPFGYLPLYAVAASGLLLTFSVAAQPKATRFAPYRLASTQLADLNGDGKPEKIVCSIPKIQVDYGAVKVEVFRQTASGWSNVWSWKAPDFFIVFGSSPSAADFPKLKDINGDGHPDLLISVDMPQGSQDVSRFQAWTMDKKYIMQSIVPPLDHAYGATLVTETNAKRKGLEILNANFIWGDEGHSAPHRYEISVYATIRGSLKYTRTLRFSTKLKYAQPDLMLTKVARLLRAGKFRALKAI